MMAVFFIFVNVMENKKKPQYAIDVLMWNTPIHWVIELNFILLYNAIWHFSKSLVHIIFLSVFWIVQAFFSSWQAGLSKTVN